MNSNNSFRTQLVLTFNDLVNLVFDSSAILMKQKPNNLKSIHNAFIDRKTQYQFVLPGTGTIFSTLYGTGKKKLQEMKQNKIR